MAVIRISMANGWRAAGSRWPGLGRVGQSRGNVAAAVAAAGTGGILVLPDTIPRAATLPLVAAAVGGLAAVMLLASRSRRPGDTPDRAVAGRLVALLLLLAVVAPPHRAHDLWQQAFYGRMVTAHDASPYTHSPAEFAADPGFDRMGPMGQGERSRSGPAFTGLSVGIATAAGDSALATRLAYQVLAAIAVGAALLLLDRRTRDPVVVAVIGCNPVVVVYAVNGNPAPALAGLGLVAAFLAAEKGRHLLGGAILAVSILVLPIAGLVLLPLIAWVARQHGLRRAAAVLLAPIVVVPAGFLLAGGRAVAEALFAAPSEEGWSPLWRPAHGLLSMGGDHADLVTRYGAIAVVALAIVVLAIVATKLSHPSPAVAGAAVLVVYAVGAPYLSMAVLVPAVVLLAAHWRERFTAIALAFVTALVLAGEYAVPDPVVDGLDRFLEDASSVLPIAAIVALALVALDAGVYLAPAFPRAIRSLGGMRGIRGIRGKGPYFPLRGGLPLLRGRRARGG